MAFYPTRGDHFVDTASGEHMVYDGFGWIKEPVHSSEFTILESDFTIDDPNGEETLNRECEKYGFVYEYELDFRYKISMPFEGNVVDMGYVDASVVATSNEHVVAIMGEFWKQAQREIKQYYEKSYQ